MIYRFPNGVMLWNRCDDDYFISIHGGIWVEITRDRFDQIVISNGMLSIKPGRPDEI